MADRRQTKSKYTADRGIPGAFEGETVTRRRFMTGTVHLTGLIGTAAIILPSLGFALGPMFEKHPEPWQAVGAVDEFDAATYVPKVIVIVAGIGQAGKSTVYVRKRDPKIDTEPQDQYNQFVAISTRCMHLGCPVRFVEAAGRRFVRSTASTPASATARSRSARATRSTASSSASRRATRARRSTASARTSTPRALRCASSPEPDPPWPNSSSPRRPRA